MYEQLHACLVVYMYEDTHWKSKSLKRKRQWFQILRESKLHKDIPIKKITLEDSQHS